MNWRPPRPCPKTTQCREKIRRGIAWESVHGMCRTECAIITLNNAEKARSKSTNASRTPPRSHLYQKGSGSQLFAKMQQRGAHDRKRNSVWKGPMLSGRGAGNVLKKYPGLKIPRRSIRPASACLFSAAKRKTGPSRVKQSATVGRDSSQSSGASPGVPCLETHPAANGGRSRACSHRGNLFVTVSNIEKKLS